MPSNSELNNKVNEKLNGLVEKNNVTIVESQNKNGGLAKVNGSVRSVTNVTKAAVVVPPDGGWGWVVMISSFMCNVIVDGIVMTAGFLLSGIQLEFNVTKAEASFVSSLLSGFYLLAGPFVSALANRWGFRVCTIIGSVLAALSFAISYFATSVPFLYVTYGVLGGIGFCFIYMPSVLTVGYYFERWRALATGISLCGSGVGTFLFAPLVTQLVDTYGWRHTLLIQAGIIIICILFGMTYSPIKPTEITIEDTTMLEEPIKNDGLNSNFTKPLPDGRFAYSVPNSVHNTWIGASHNTQYPTAAEVFRGSGANLDRRPSGTPSGVLSTTNFPTKKLEAFSKAQRRSSGQSTPEEVFVQLPPLMNIELKTVGEDDEENESGALIEDQLKPVGLTARRHTVSGKRDVVISRSSSRRESNEGSRPMYRDDIFFSGSLVRIPQYQSQTSLGYHMSVTRMPTKQDVYEEMEHSCKLCPEAVRRTLATMLDMSLLKSPSFILLAFSGFFTMMGFFVPFVLGKERATNAGGMDENSASMIISAIGVSNTIARILCGTLSSFKGMNALYINNVFITLGGLATIISGVSYSPAFQYTYGAVFGMAIACFSALRSILVVDLMGLEKLTNAFGILMMFQGLAAVMGAPLAGFFFDLTKSYDVSFYIAGALITLSGILCFPLNIVKAWENKRAESQKIAVKV